MIKIKYIYKYINHWHQEITLEKGVIAVKDNSTNYYDQALLTATKGYSKRLKTVYKGEIYTIIAHEDEHTGISVYTQHGESNFQMKIYIDTGTPTLAYFDGEKNYYCANEYEIENKVKIEFIDTEDQSNSIIKFFTPLSGVDIFLETTDIFGAHPAKGIKYWDDGNGNKLDPVNSQLSLKENDSTIILKSVWGYLNKPIMSITSYGNLIKANKSTSTSASYYSSGGTGGSNRGT